MPPIIRCCAPIVFLMAVSAASAAPRWEPHHTLIGFNLEYPDRTELSELALREIERLGVRDVRIYEIFNGRRDRHYQARLKDALDRVLAHNMRPLISLSNVVARLQPNEQKRWQLAQKLPKRVGEKIEDHLTYTNRFPPSDWDAYRASIQELLDFLFLTYGKKRVIQWAFEIANEPDAPLYFWGDSNEFKRLYEVAFDVLRANGVNEIGGFGSTQHPIFMSPELERSADYRALLQKLVKDTNRRGFLSFHLYAREERTQTPLAGLPPWVSNAIFPVMITEWNVSSRGDVAAKAFKEPGAWGASFILLLADCFRHGIDRVYVFKLMDYPPHQTMQLGAFDREGKAKPWYRDLAAIYRVIRDGYRVVDDGFSLTLEGTNGSRVVLAAGKDIILPSISSSYSLLYSPFELAISEGKVRAGQWAVLSRTQERRQQ